MFFKLFAWQIAVLYIVASMSDANININFLRWVIDSDVLVTSTIFSCKYCANLLFCFFKWKLFSVNVYTDFFICYTDIIVYRNLFLFLLLLLLAWGINTVLSLTAFSIDILIGCLSDSDGFVTKLCWQLFYG